MHDYRHQQLKGTQFERDLWMQNIQVRYLLCMFLIKTKWLNDGESIVQIVILPSADLKSKFSQSATSGGGFGFSKFTHYT